MKVMFGIYLIAFMQMLSSCYQKAEPETYLIPSNYTGEVNILFNQNGVTEKYKNEYGRDTVFVPELGAPVKYENGRRLYKISTDGILLTQFKENDGFIDRQYYSVENNGKRTPLEIFKFEHFKQDSAGYVVSDPNKKGIFGDGTSGSYGNMHIFFQDFTVGSYNQLDSFNAKEYRKHFDDKIEKITGLTLNLK
jgi:hypothetical protein